MGLQPGYCYVAKYVDYDERQHQLLVSVEGSEFRIDLAEFSMSVFLHNDRQIVVSAVREDQVIFLGTLPPGV